MSAQNGVVARLLLTPDEIALQLARKAYGHAFRRLERRLSTFESQFGETPALNSAIFLMAASRLNSLADEIGTEFAVLKRVSKTPLK